MVIAQHIAQAIKENKLSACGCHGYKMQKYKIPAISEMADDDWNIFKAKRTNLLLCQLCKNKKYINCISDFK